MNEVEWKKRLNLMPKTELEKAKYGFQDASERVLKHTRLDLIGQLQDKLEGRKTHYSVSLLKEVFPDQSKVEAVSDADKIINILK